MDSVKQQTFEGHVPPQLLGNSSLVSLIDTHVWARYRMSILAQVISVHRQGETFTLARFAMTAAQAVYAEARLQREELVEGCSRE